MGQILILRVIRLLKRPEIDHGRHRTGGEISLSSLAICASAESAYPRPRWSSQGQAFRVLMGLG